MLIFFGAVARFRRPVLVAEVVVVAVWFGFVRPHGDPAGWVTFLVASIGILLAVLADTGYRPVTLTADPERRVLATPAPLFMFTAYLAVRGGRLAETRQDLRWLDAGLGVPALVVMAALFVTAWRDLGVRLRPDGVEDRQPFGSPLSPWEAFEPGSPPAPGGRNSALRFTCRRPDLVRRRGVLLAGRGTVPVRNADRVFLAGVLDHYGRHPGHRAAIGAWVPGGAQ